MAWGAKVVTVDLPVDRPHEGADFYAQQVAAQIPAGEPPIVVAHSGAGLILPLVASHLEVARLVYLAAVIPFPQLSFLSQFHDAPDMMHQEWRGKNPVANHDDARHFLFHDCDERTTAWALTTLRLWMASGVWPEPCPLVHYPSVPTDYVSATFDRTINAVFWERAASKRHDIEPIRMATGHAPHVAQPGELARILLGVAGYISAGPSK